MKNKSNGAIKNYRGEIIVGLVTSAIWFSLEWIIKSAPKTGKNVLATIQNLIYSCAAKVSLNYTISIILSIILGVLTVIAISPLITNYLSKKSKMKMKEMEERVDKLKKEPNDEDKKK